jgi:hypothetical protein
LWGRHKGEGLKVVDGKERKKLGKALYRKALRASIEILPVKLFTIAPLSTAPSFLQLFSKQGLA